MKYVTADGGVWRLSERSYQILLIKVASGDDVDLDQLGKLVANNLVPLDDLRMAARDAGLGNYE